MGIVADPEIVNVLLSVAPKNRFTKT